MDGKQYTNGNHMKQDKHWERAHTGRNKERVRRVVATPLLGSLARQNFHKAYQPSFVSTSDPSNRLPDSPSSRSTASRYPTRVCCCLPFCKNNSLLSLVVVHLMQLPSAVNASHATTWLFWETLHWLPVYQLASATLGMQFSLLENDVSEWKDERRRRREVATLLFRNGHDT